MLNYSKNHSGILPEAVRGNWKGSKVKSDGRGLPKGKRVTTRTLRTLKGLAWRIFSRYIRLRDCLFTTGTTAEGRCVTCGFLFSFAQLQAGHFVSGRHNANLFSEEGVHAQCRLCNIVKKGNQLQYRRAIVNLYGDGYDLVLEAEAKQIKKFTPQDLLDLIEHYKKEIAKLETK